MSSYFAGWRGHLLSQGGREVLINAVQSSFPILLPKGAIDYIDAKRRAFLWTGEKTCSGGACKAPWELVCLPKDKGGLGIKDLTVQNRCLLQKFLTKLHDASASPWHSWFSATYGRGDSRDLGDLRTLDTPVWSGIVDGLQDFRSMTAVSIGNGCRTSFWLDLWLGDQTLAQRFPALYSHSRR